MGVPAAAEPERMLASSFPGGGGTWLRPLSPSRPRIVQGGLPRLSRARNGSAGSVTVARGANHGNERGIGGAGGIRTREVIPSN